MDKGIQGMNENLIVTNAVQFLYFLYYMKVILLSFILMKNATCLKYIRKLHVVKRVVTLY